jgi:hypothetical protein
MAKDLLLDADDDLLIEGGDLVADDSAEQEVGLIFRSNQGDWRDSPLTGFGVARRTRNAVNPDEFASALSSQLEMDGFATNQVNLAADGQLTIYARRNE